MTDSSLRWRIVRSGSVLATALFLASGALSQDAPGAVYAMTNAGGNSILIFARAATGALTSAGSAATGYCMAHFRQVFLDGRTLANDPNPTWLGYSVGRWEGDALAVESTGFNGKIWLEGAGGAGHPTTEALHITERFRRRDFGHLDLGITIDDPMAYTKPLTVAGTLHISPDSELLEYVCNENERDAKHIVGK